MITDEQKTRLEQYKTVFLTDIQNQMADESFAVYQKIKGYLQALNDIGQITDNEMNTLLKEYAL